MKYQFLGFAMLALISGCGAKINATVEADSAAAASNADPDWEFITGARSIVGTWYKCAGPSSDIGTLMSLPANTSISLTVDIHDETTSLTMKMFESNEACLGEPDQVQAQPTSTYTVVSVTGMPAGFFVVSDNTDNLHSQFFVDVDGSNIRFVFSAVEDFYDNASEAYPDFSLWTSYSASGLPSFDGLNLDNFSADPVANGFFASRVAD